MNRRNFLKFFGLGLAASVATRAAQARVCERQNGLLDRMYPVGAIYISISSVNPGTHLGGTWVRFGEGAVLAGVSTTDSDFDFRANFTVRGAKTHTLTSAQMPAHNHPFTNATGSFSTRDADGRVGIFALPSGNNGVYSGRNFTSAYSAGHTFHSGSRPQDIDFNLANGGFTINNSGSGAAHNNLPPYITVFMWRRSS